MSWRAQGFRAWLIQRLTAVYMAVFIVWFVLAFSLSTPNDYESWRAWMGDTTTATATAIFFLALLAHAWVGVRDVVIDYVHSFLVRFTVLACVGLTLSAWALWSLRVLFKATL